MLIDSYGFKKNGTQETMKGGFKLSAHFKVVQKAKGAH